MLAKSHPTLCDPMVCSLPGSSVHGILQTILEWAPCPPPGDLPDPGIEPASPALAGGFFITRATWEAQNTLVRILESSIYSGNKCKLILRLSTEHCYC